MSDAKPITFSDLRNVNVSTRIEKKGNLSYLSWPYAVDELLQKDTMATWEFPDPKNYGKTVMVYCNVTAFGKTMKMQLPVMDNRNSAVQDPDARKISDAQMRCLVKCIACFGIGLYIYAGEDLPSGGVFPEQPGDEDGDSNYIQPYTVPFGQWKKKTLPEIAAQNSIEAIESYFAVIDGYIQKGQYEPSHPAMKEFKDKMTKYLADAENQEQK